MVGQPRNRGTAPAVVYALLRLTALGFDGPVALFPSDHHFSDDRAFMWAVEQAFETVSTRPSLTVLLGMAADRPEVEYGWIEPADLILGRWPWPIYRVRRFWEKPSKPIAERLEAAGCLWNCFVVVARPSTLEQLIRRATPNLYRAFAPLRLRLGTPWEEDTARAVYGGLPSTDLSRHVFQTCAGSLAVLPVTGVSWTDLGDPLRVREAQARLGWHSAIA